MNTEKKLEAQILENFASVAQTIGYSPLHGKIIGVLLIEGKPVSLNELAKETGYSSSMISLSLDFLEVMEVIKKVKKSGDRKLYVKLNGDLLNILKKAIVTRVKKTISESLIEFEENRKNIDKLPAAERKRVRSTLDKLEKEIQRLDYYVQMLSSIELP
jgi:HTH-type transcriptional regulator, osmoprotectant uptake regulator